MYQAAIRVKDGLVIFRGDKGALSVAKLILVGDENARNILDELVRNRKEWGPSSNDGATYMRVELRDDLPEQFESLFEDLPEYGVVTVSV